MRSLNGNKTEVHTEGAGSGPPRAAFLDPGGLGLGDVLVVGLVLQLLAEVVDGFVQTFLQRDLVVESKTWSPGQTHSRRRWGQRRERWCLLATSRSHKTTPLRRLQREAVGPELLPELAVSGVWHSSPERHLTPITVMGTTFSTLQGPSFRRMCFAVKEGCVQGHRPNLQRGPPHDTSPLHPWTGHRTPHSSKRGLDKPYSSEAAISRAAFSSQETCRPSG